VLKALEKDCDRRYETADGFAQDVLRHLADEPVLARPPTRAYRFRKFVRKNRGAVVVATVTLLTLLGGIAGTTVGMLRARAAEMAAVTARKGEADQLREATTSATAARNTEAAARKSEAEATGVLRFVREWVFAAGQPKEWDCGLRPDVTLRDAIRAAEPKITDTFADRPLVEASVREVLGTMDQYLADAEPAARQHEHVLRIRSKQLGPNGWLTSTAKNNPALYRGGRAAGRELVRTVGGGGPRRAGGGTNPG
jgi:hypothetical protein